MRPPCSGILPISQLFGGNPAAERYTAPDGKTVIGHDGIDVAVPEGTEVYPAWDGWVEVVNASWGFGLHIILHGDNGALALYGHLSSVSVSDKARVQIHHPMALSGSTGNSTGPHIHFLVKPNGYDVDNGYDGAVDPLPYFDHDVYPNIDLSGTNL